MHVCSIVNLVGKLALTQSTYENFPVNDYLLGYTSTVIVFLSPSAKLEVLVCVILV